MNHGDLKDRLGEMLKVNTKRYPPSWRTYHLNLALRSLSEEFDSQLDEDIQTWDTVADQGEYNIDTVFDAPDPIFSHPLDVYYSDSDGSVVSLEQRTYEQLLREYPAGSDGGKPLVFCIFQRQIWLRPTPDAVYSLVWSIQGYMRDLSADSDQNSWTDKYPFLLLYRALEHSCVFLLEYNRVPGYQALAEKELVRVIANNSMRESARRPISQEPG